MKRAFTLVELMVVTGIIVLLAAATVPQMRGVTADLRLREAADDVKLLLENSRRQAADSGVAVVVTRDDERLPSGVVCTMNGERAIVFPDGRIFDPDTAEPVFVRVTDERRVSWQVTTAGTCGALLVSRHEK